MQPAWVNEWGSTPDERVGFWPCDALLPDADAVLYRAVDVIAPAAVAFRWLCQLRVAPYSYDRLDNRGRPPSPTTLTPGLDDLEVGQRFMIFDLVDFTPGEQITLRTRNDLFGVVVVTYRVRPINAGSCRLVVKLRVRHRRDLLGTIWRAVLPAGDLVMMRKQLLTLAALAEGRHLST